MANAVNNTIGKYPTWDELQQLRAVNPTAYIQKVSKILLDGTCPMTVRECYEALHSSKLLSRGESDGQNVRIKVLTGAVLGASFCVATRVIRTVWKTTFLVVPLGPLCAYGKSSRYKMDARDDIRGEVANYCVTTGEEWTDLAVSVGAVGMSLIQIIGPEYFEGRLEGLVKYYINRISDHSKREEKVDELMSAYRQRQKEIKVAWKNGQPPVRIRDEQGNDNNLNDVPDENSLLIGKKKSEQI